MGYEYMGALHPWRDEIISLRQKGWSPRDIERMISPRVREYFRKRYPTAGHYGYYMPDILNTIFYILRNYGAHPGHQSHLDILRKANNRKREIWKLYQNGKTVKELMELYGISDSRVRQEIEDGKDIAERDKKREHSERILENVEVIGKRIYVNGRPALPPKTKGRPIDMGGPRDVWIDCELWDFPLRKDDA